MSNVLSDKDHLCPRLLKGRLEVDTQKDRYTIFAISKCTQHVLNVLMSSPDVTVVFTLVLLLQASVEEHVLLLQCSSTCFVVAVFKHMFCCCSVQAHVLLLQCSSTYFVVAGFCSSTCATSWSGCTTGRMSHSTMCSACSHTDPLTSGKRRE